MHVFSPHNPFSDQLCFEDVFKDNACAVEIYNRWGEQVWVATDSLPCWFGYHCNTGNKLTSGVYFICIRNNTTKDSFDTVTLIR
jgi:hypothetical protein